MIYLLPLSVRKNTKAQNYSELSLCSDFHERAQVCIDSIIILNDGDLENTFTVVRYPTTSSIKTILEMVAMSKERDFNKLYWPYIWIKSGRVYSSRYFQEVQTQSVKWLNLDSIKEPKRRITSSSLV